jgi:antitoxin (DNA-binding transcriptional repressor) of toxin-antitoxin stability system
MALQRTITQRELRNDSGEVMRSLDRGDSFIVTRNGIPVGTLAPFHTKQLVQKSVVLEAFRSAPAIDAIAFRADVDAFVDQALEPRA